MGYMFHDAIIVTVNDRDAQRIHARAVEIFATFDDTPSTFKGETLVSDLTRGAVNCYESFAVFPDGSKEGWSTSDEGDRCRSELIAFLRSESVDFVHVRFGGDGGDGGGEDLTAIVTHGDDFPASPTQETP